jgi:hypothetical protein
MDNGDDDYLTLVLPVPAESPFARLPDEYYHDCLGVGNYQAVDFANALKVVSAELAERAGDPTLQVPPSKSPAPTSPDDLADAEILRAANEKLSRRIRGQLSGLAGIVQVAVDTNESDPHDVVALRITVKRGMARDDTT